MAILEIRTFPDPILRQKTRPVDKFDANLKKLVDDMFDTMYDAPGVGLAANQVGVSLRVVVMDVDYSVEEDPKDENNRIYKNKNPLVIINPVLQKKSGKTLFKEGCLSVPGFSEQVERFEKVSIEYQKLDGSKAIIDAEGLLAIAFQHELDHLEGKLYIDRLSEIKRSLIKGKIRKERDKKFDRSKFHVEL
ncbi:MAG: peptide deformylase [Bacteriovoracia bacterium]